MTHVSTSVSDICSTALSMTTYQTTLLRNIVLDDSIINFFASSGRVTSKNLCFPTDDDDSNCSPSDAAAPLQLLHGCCCHEHHIVFALIHCYFFLQHIGRFSQECEAHGKHVHVFFPPLGTSVRILTDIKITRVRSLGVSTATLSFTFITYPQIILHLLLGAWRGEHCHH